jgi:hypothetical protein
LLQLPAAGTAAAAIAAGDANADDTQRAWVESMNAEPKVRHMMALMVPGTITQQGLQRCSTILCWRLFMCLYVQSFQE